MIPKEKIEGIHGEGRDFCYVRGKFISRKTKTRDGPVRRDYSRNIQVF